MAALREIIEYCDQRLDIGRFQDYCPNGLQVEACSQVYTLVTGVTASQALIEAAVERRADLLLVHHGYFWKGEAQPLTGMKGRRVQALMQAKMSMAAYHLPLDAHPELGNNVQWGQRLELAAIKCLSDDGLLWGGRLPTATNVADFTARIEALAGRTPLWLPGGPQQIERLAWCTGGAQSLLEAAAQRGFDAFISGEVSESTFHAASELGIHYFAAGHHATERYGVQALGEELASKFGVRHINIDLPNPV